jgi:hypothetical protein
MDGSFESSPAKEGARCRNGADEEIGWKNGEQVGGKAD